MASNSDPMDKDKKKTEVKDTPSLKESEDTQRHSKDGQSKENVSQQSGCGNNLEVPRNAATLARGLVAPERLILTAHTEEKEKLAEQGTSVSQELSFTAHKYIGYPKKVSISTDETWTKEEEELDEAQSKTEVKGQLCKKLKTGDDEQQVTVFDTHKVVGADIPLVSKHGELPPTGKGWTQVAKGKAKMKSPVRATRQSHRIR